MTQTETQTQELVLYDIVNRSFELENIYAFGGVTPNAKYIARQYGCNLEFRWSQFRETGITSYFPGFLERCSIGRDGSCISAILVGDDRKKLAEAREDIRATFGISKIHDSTVDIGDKKTLFS